MLRLLSLVPVFFFLTACAGSQEAMKCGQGIYAVSASAEHHYGNYVKRSRNAALVKAHAFCETKGKQMSVENIDEGFRTHVTFRCLAEGDPEPQQSGSRRKPLTTIGGPCN